ncbi:MAG: Flp pilus assembly complex ATPase component TadA [Oscillospiraceae bacterium]|nr:Flp pilus assembly complex ATPase component TadA [Oscillospiraceae bacterium]
MKKEDITGYFCGAVGESVRKISDAFFEDIQEIRLRVNRPAAASMKNTIRYITNNGQLTYNTDSAVIVSEQDLRRCFESVCQYSVHSFQSEITNGFITIRGGHRVGICGTSVMRGDTIENVKNISSLNFRIAREVTGCAGDICNRIFSDGLHSVLIAGAPSSGKTTLLRDMARILGERFRTAVIDERGELAAVMNGIPQNNIGINTDVFDGYDKPRGIITALRVMSPQIIICDEIGSDKDLAAIRAASNSGVYVAASVHAAGVDELKRKDIDLDIFDYIVFLSGCIDPGHISETVKIREVKNV